MGGACSNLSTPVESPARVHEVKALPHNFTDSKVQAVGAVIEPYDADAEKSRNPTEVDMSDKYAEPPKDSQIQEWMGSMDAIPEDVLVDALRQLAAYEARCRGDAPLLAIAEAAESGTAPGEDDKGGGASKNPNVGQSCKGDGEVNGEHIIVDDEECLQGGIRRGLSPVDGAVSRSMHGINPRKDEGVVVRRNSLVQRTASSNSEGFFPRNLQFSPLPSKSPDVGSPTWKISQTLSRNFSMNTVMSEDQKLEDILGMTASAFKPVPGFSHEDGMDSNRIADVGKRLVDAKVVDAFFEIVDHVGPQPDADTFFAFLNVDGPKKEVSKNTFIYGCAAMGTGILKNDAGKLFEALTGPEKTILEGDALMSILRHSTALKSHLGMLDPSCNASSPAGRSASC